MLKNNNSIEAPVIIQDILIVAQNKANSYGEFNRQSTMQAGFVDVNSTIDRMYNTISQMAGYTASLHVQDNCDSTGELLSHKRNNITRLATHEFFFYTTTPLTLAQFQHLQQKLVDLARRLPENLQLALGTFAVLTPDNKVMNVVSHIECGKNPDIKLISKSNPFSTDPAYFGCPNVDANVDSLNYEIYIDNKPVSFTFNNAFRCKTADGAEYYSCVDICADFEVSLGKKNLVSLLTSDNLNNETLKHLTMQGSQLLLSNSIYLNMGEPIYGSTITYVDPQAAFTPNDLRFQRYELTQSQFGSSAFLYVPHPFRCEQIPKNLLVQAILESIALQTDLDISQKTIDKKLERIEFLVQQDADPDIKNKLHLSALNYAFMAERSDIAKTLLEKGADPHIADNMNMTPLHYAVKSGNIDMVRLLLEKIIFTGFLYKKDNENFSPLHYAVQGGDLQIVKLLLEKIPAGNDNIIEVFKNITPQQLHHKDGQGESLFQILTQAGHVDVLESFSRAEKNNLGNIGLFHHPERSEKEKSEHADKNEFRKK